MDTISTPAKDLISRLPKVNPEERTSAAELMKHPWLQDSQVIRRATALMKTQVKGRKRGGRGGC